MMIFPAVIKLYLYHKKFVNMLLELISKLFLTGLTPGKIIGEI